jgi:hypothetical protein
MNTNSTPDRYINSFPSETTGQSAAIKRLLGFISKCMVLLLAGGCAGCAGVPDAGKGGAAEGEVSGAIAVALAKRAVKADAVATVAAVKRIGTATSDKEIAKAADKAAEDGISADEIQEMLAQIANARVKKESEATERALETERLSTILGIDTKDLEKWFGKIKDFQYHYATNEELQLLVFSKLPTPSSFAIENIRETYWGRIESIFQWPEGHLINYMNTHYPNAPEFSPQEMQELLAEIISTYLAS